MSSLSDNYPERQVQAIKKLKRELEEVKQDLARVTAERDVALRMIEPIQADRDKAQAELEIAKQIVRATHEDYMTARREGATLRALVERWRDLHNAIIDDANEGYGTVGEADYVRGVKMCADELEAALAEPEPKG